MKREAVEELLTSLKDRGLIGSFSDSGDEHFGITCLFGSRHRDGGDERSSATVSYGDDISMVLCHACGYHATLLTAITLLWSEHGPLAEDLLDYVRAHEVAGSVTLKKVEKPYAPHDYSEALAQLVGPLPPEALEFLEKKGCPEKVVTAMRCGWIKDTKLAIGKKEDVHVRDTIVFPLFTRLDDKVICIGAQARPLVSDKRRSKYFTIFPFKSGRHLYGEHLALAMQGRRVFIFEGPLDVLHFWSIGEAALGLFGLSVSREKAAVLARSKARVGYVLLDPDQNEVKAADGTRKAAKMAALLSSDALPVRPLYVDRDPRTLTKQDVILLLSNKRRTNGQESQ